ncbi:hypothetical protein, partial [Streptomyces capoamus]|uniref:hypothetical protein n=1 Tax=Streptomyces capoamus TaxID=68183 RepID=UPI001E3D2F5D
MSVARRTVLGAGLAAVPVPASGTARAGEAPGGPAMTEAAGGPRVTDPGAYVSFTGGAFSLVGAPVVASPEDHPG